MTKDKLALDGYSEILLLSSICSIQDLLEDGKNKKALKAIKELIAEIQNSEIIDSYTLFDPMDEIRLEDAIEEIKDIVKTYPNDMDLGGNIRAFVTTHLK